MRTKLRKWSTSFILMVTLESILFIGLWMIEKLSGVGMGWNFSENNDAFYTILSIAFIVSSLTSILSEKNMPIYWSDVEYEMLVRPRFTNIVSIIGYICATVVVSSVVNIIKPEYIIWCLWITIILLIILTSKAIMSHFSKSRIKTELQREFMTGKLIEEKELLIEITIKNIDSNEIQYTLENIKLLKDAKCEKEVEYLLNYASEVNPFILYKVVNELKINAIDTIYLTLERLIQEGSDYSAMNSLLKEFMYQDMRYLIDTYVNGINDITLSKGSNGDPFIAYYEFDKAKNMVELYIKTCNEKIMEKPISISKLLIEALINNQYTIVCRIINLYNDVRKEILHEVTQKMKNRYSDSETIKNLLPYFESKLNSFDFMGKSENVINEIRCLLIKAINAHQISNDQLNRILNGLKMSNDPEILAAGKTEYRFND